ncbi:MAG: mannose-1-phosphate guanylyltransferase/mannose-6-phosphate isomerase [Thermodesulfobacteriota bacterium]
MSESNAIIPVILAGGAGARLWPLSNREHPKQFLPLAGDCSMLHATLTRAAALSSCQPMILCQEEHRFLVAEEARQAGGSPLIVVQPADRDTAPAVAAAASLAQATGDDPLLLVLPTDHLIDDLDIFRNAVTAAASLANQGLLVSLGVVPSQPHTGYGYLQPGQALADTPPPGGCRAARFVEKPDPASAARFLAEGWLWNSGIFLFRASTLLAALRGLAPEMATRVEAACTGAQRDPDFLRLADEPFLRCQSQSLDYAIMEKTANLALVRLDCGWLDLGSWAALWEIAPKDGLGNVRLGRVVAEDCRGNYLRAEGPSLAVLGLEGHVVVTTPEAVLVAPLARAQEIKRLAEGLDSTECALPAQTIFLP